MFSSAKWSTLPKYLQVLVLDVKFAHEKRALSNSVFLITFFLFIQETIFEIYLSSKFRAQPWRV